MKEPGMLKGPLPERRLRRTLSFAGGILFTMVVAGAGYLLSMLPVVNRLGTMIPAILLAVVYRHWSGYPERIREGIQFSSQKILRLAIILFGFQLNMEQILGEGFTLLWKDAVSILLALMAVLVLARLMGADRDLSFLLGVGTGVCGAAAIAAVSPIIGSKEEDTATGVGIIALAGTVFTLLYTLLRPFLPFSASQYGIWSGLSLHEMAHVAAAAAPAGTDALAVSLLTKLGRVFLLIPLCLVLIFWIKRKRGGDRGGKVPFPWFLAGFVGTCLIGSYLPVPQEVTEGLSALGSFLLASAMVGLGLNIHFRSLKQKALKPLIAMLIASVFLSLVSGWLVDW
ncbi:YeiH family protein [Paludifilum halophilum]|uniref:Sulfate exporter family transporter n=1 Tax=Paludifilum halophilum TaxID=1642702 RepID=A0A235BB05_9BACL|nr:putative sulfate exporter family transporter [Paludifilum halophilum]OYD09179.1 hypothetical protein CHM34_04355 [Paludifilum halophilum]